MRGLGVQEIIGSFRLHLVFFKICWPKISTHIPRAFSEHTQSVPRASLGASLEHPQSITGASPEHPQSIPRVPPEHPQSIPEHPQCILRASSKHPQNIPWASSEHPHLNSTIRTPYNTGVLSDISCGYHLSTIILSLVIKFHDLFNLI